MSAGHVDAIASAVRGLDQVTAAEFFSNCGTLLDKAQSQGVDTFGQTCRDLARQVTAEHAAGSEVAELERQRAASKIKRWTDKETGMRHTLISLDPERDKLFWTAVSHSLRKVAPEAGARQDAVASARGRGVAGGMQRRRRWRARAVADRAV